MSNDTKKNLGLLIVGVLVAVVFVPDVRDFVSVSIEDTIQDIAKPLMMLALVVFVIAILFSESKNKITGKGGGNSKSKK
jgi:hypothetical protein